MTRFARHERAQHADSQIDNINLRIVSGARRLALRRLFPAAFRGMLFHFGGFPAQLPLLPTRDPFLDDPPYPRAQPVGFADIAAVFPEDPSAFLQRGVVLRFRHVPRFVRPVQLVPVVHLYVPLRGKDHVQVFIDKHSDPVLVPFRPLDHVRVPYGGPVPFIRGLRIVFPFGTVVPVRKVHDRDDVLFSVRHFD